MKSYSIKIKHGNNSENARLDIFTHELSPEMKYEKRPLILVIPGGGYEYVSDREADPIAFSLFSEGVNVAILHYSVKTYTYPTQYFEAFEALKNIIDNADEYNTDPTKIATCGFSAGGHLAAMVGTGYNDPLVLKEFGVEKDFFKLKGMILSYPVITSGEFAHRGSFDHLLGDKKDDKEMLSLVSIENRITKETPNTFIWHTFPDMTVPLENTLLLVNELRKNDIPFELHIFPEGDHGLSRANDLTETKEGWGLCSHCEIWIDLLKAWIKKNLPIA